MFNKFPFMIFDIAYHSNTKMHHSMIQPANPNGTLKKNRQIIMPSLRVITHYHDTKFLNSDECFSSDTVNLSLKLECYYLLSIN